ncbi:MAG TPA: hypothetical protein OIM59_09205 [Bacteroides mediterraneensis]|uniref:hypothetical protein n=1 Tax=Bacteroides mediterraneensis TaxID=1841856 RepID=UPI0026EF2E30|nr:hypothetical protein [Bacteroides mediterraneensis]HJH64789.1 hypothetical protein [Bacteroides mediterraneensis]
MSLNEIYKDILCLFNRNKHDDYIANLSHLYERFYELLKKENEELARDVLYSTTTILSFINGEKNGSELLIENVNFPSLIIQYKEVFYRARSVTSEVKERDFNAQCMFHIPLMSKKMNSGRFDREGMIRLYLSKSCFSCFCEVTPVEGEDLMISLFKFIHTEPLQIIDFRLKSEFDFNELRLKEKRNYLLCLPYILACMFIKNGSLEYIFPQYVMSVLDYMDEKLQKKYDGNKNKVFTPYIGLSYTSVHFDNEFIRRENKDCLYDNYVFLAKHGKKNIGTSKLLSDMFVVTNPLRCQWRQKSDYKRIEDSLNGMECYQIE